MSLDQRHFQLALKTGDLVRDRRLGQEQTFRGAREAQILGDRNKNAQSLHIIHAPPMNEINEMYLYNEYTPRVRARYLPCGKEANRQSSPDAPQPATETNRSTRPAGARRAGVGSVLCGHLLAT